MLLRVIFELGEDAYGMTMQGAMEERLGHSVSLGAVYIALDELKVKGYISFNHGDPTPERGNRPKCFVFDRAGGHEPDRKTGESGIFMKSKAGVTVRAEGYAEVGVNARREVVVRYPGLELDANGVGYVIFTPRQAARFARLLLKHASAIDGKL